MLLLEFGDVRRVCACFFGAGDVGSFGWEGVFDLGMTTVGSGKLAAWRDFGHWLSSWLALGRTPNGRN